MLIAEALRIVGEKLEHAALLGKLAAEASMQRDIAGDIAVQHDRSPGQG